METLKTQKFCNITVAASWAKGADRGKGRQASSQERAEASLRPRFCRRRFRAQRRGRLQMVRRLPASLSGA